MAKIARCFFAFFLFIYFTGCTDDQFPIERDYPIVETQKASDIDSSGVTLKAKILSGPSAQITDFGFHWQNDMTINTYSLKGKVNIETFELRVAGDLTKESIYNCRAYITTDKLTVYGNEIFFKSEGAGKPKFIDFTPKSGVTGDTITIYGENFALSENRSKVYFSYIKVSTIERDSNMVKFLVPDSYQSGDIKLSLYSGEYEIVIPDYFTLPGAKILDVNPKELYPGDTITITGTEFGETLEQNYVYVTSSLNTTNKILKVISASSRELKAIIPDGLNSGEYNLRLIVNEKTNFYNKTITVL